MKKETVFIMALAVVIALALIFFLTPVYSWLTGSNEEPAINPSQFPTSSGTTTVPTQAPSPKLVVTMTGKTLVFSEQELKEIMNQLVIRANSSGKASIEYMDVKMEADRMLLSVKGEAMGVSVEAENLVVHCEGRTVSMAGVVKAWTYEPELELTIDITTTEGKPVVTITKFRLGGVTLILSVMGLSRDKMQAIMNDTIASSGWKLPADLESISIQMIK